MPLREYLQTLERNGELHRTDVEIDSCMEMIEVAIRALREGKPALLIQQPKNSAFPAVINHFSSDKRIELILVS